MSLEREARQLLIEHHQVLKVMDRMVKWGTCRPISALDKPAPDQSRSRGRQDEAPPHRQDILHRLGIISLALSQSLFSVDKLDSDTRFFYEWLRHKLSQAEKVNDQNIDQSAKDLLEDWLSGTGVLGYLDPVKGEIVLREDGYLNLDDEF